MLVLTLVLAAIGFALLVAALTTGSVVWAWGCIVVCVIGAVLLLVSALSTRESDDDVVIRPGRHAKR
jgi:Na+/melibiose symporter-like transporter